MVTPATFTGLEIIAAVAFAVPLALDLLHLRLLPAVVFEVLAGILIGPYGLHWVTADEPVQIFSLIGLGFLLFLAGMEVDITRFRGPLFRLALTAFGCTVVLALLVGFLFSASGLVRSPLFFSNILVATSLGVILPPLKGAGEVDTPFGQLAILSATLAEFGSLLLLTALFSSVVVSTPDASVLPRLLCDSRRRRHRGGVAGRAVENAHVDVGSAQRLNGADPRARAPGRCWRRLSRWLCRASDSRRFSAPLSLAS